MPTPCDAYVPAWARQAVFYQIYPLGFFGAPAANNGRLECVPRLARLREQYDHLCGLGASAIYFCPVFESLSHGYDTTDYLRIDRRLGTNELFREIVGELHGLGPVPGPGALYLRRQSRRHAHPFHPAR